MNDFIGRRFGIRKALIGRIQRKVGDEWDAVLMEETQATKIAYQDTVR
jgi:hypothetical protein